MNGVHETKSEIRARIEELIRVRDEFIDDDMGDKGDIANYCITNRIGELEKQLDLAEEDLSSSIIRSHKALCKAKMMDEKAAYGNDPAVYYTLGVCGEAGEMANAIVKSLRNGVARAPILDAVKSELPDVIIYSYVLAHVLDIDLSKLVNEKVEIVVQRAINGYYGDALSSDVPGSLSKEEKC